MRCWRWSGSNALALGDAQRQQHGGPGLVDPAHRLLLEDAGQLAPVVEAARSGRVPLDVLADDEAARPRGLAHAAHRELLLHGVEETRRAVDDPKADEDVVGLALEDVDALAAVRGGVVFGSDDDVGPALALVRSGQAQVADRALPEVDHAAGRLAGRIDDLQRAAGQADEVEDVGGGQVRRDDPALFLQGVEDDEIRLAGHPVAGCVRGPPPRDADQRRAPDVGLAGALIVHLVEQPAGGVVVEVAVAQLDVADGRADQFIACEGGGLEGSRRSAHVGHLVGSCMGRTKIARAAFVRSLIGIDVTILCYSSSKSPGFHDLSNQGSSGP